MKFDIDAASNVTALPVKHRDKIEDGPYLARAPLKCAHHHGFNVDEKEAQVECLGCGAKLNPMWVLQQLCNTESRWHELHARYQDEMQRLAERSRTKCECCGEMTKISRR